MALCCDQSDKKVVFDGDGHTDNSHDNQHSADDAVDEPQGAHVEAAAQLVDEKCHRIPPHDRPAEYRQVGPDVVEEFILGQDEVKSRVKTYDKEEYQRVGESQQKSRHEIAPVVGRTVVGRLQRARRIFLEEVDAESDEHRAADELQHELMALDKTGDEAHAKACQKAVYQVAHGGAEAREEGRPAPFAQRTLDDEHSYRPHGG